MAVPEDRHQRRLHHSLRCPSPRSGRRLEGQTTHQDVPSRRSVKRSLISRRDQVSRTAVPHDAPRDVCREVGRTAPGQAVELPVPRHTSGLALVVPPAQRLPVLDGGRTTAAVRVDVVRLQVLRYATTPGEPRVLLASVSCPGEDLYPLLAREPAPLVREVTTVDHSPPPLNHPRESHPGNDADEPR